MNLQIGYCTNVHAGANLAQTKANLEQHALAVKAKFRPDREMGIGLWLSASSARNLLEANEVSQFADWLAEHGLLPFTFNGFPFGDFHQEKVQHSVYLPTWFDKARADYTRDLIAIQHQLLPTGVSGSISTVPIAWGSVDSGVSQPSKDQLHQAGKHLAQIAAELAELKAETGREIILCIEPEPGCYVEASEELIHFYQEYLLPVGDEKAIRAHIGVCHDVCHAVVMFEEQADVFQQFKSAGIPIGKIQISSAVVLPFAKIPAAERSLAIEQLSSFVEPRYLHQTTRRVSAGDSYTFYENLPDALKQAGDPKLLNDEWRVHFHVPVYLEKFGLVETSRQQIIECLKLAKQQQTTTHFEVETYAWNVLPVELQHPVLADGIAEELIWFEGQVQQ